MEAKSNQTISLIVPVELLVQIDVLAKRNFMTRSDVLRQAALAYIRRSDLDPEEVKRLSPEYVELRPKPEPKPKRKYDYEALAEKYPYVYGDREMLRFLDDYDSGRL